MSKQKSSGFWTPSKVGDTVQGKFLMISQNQNGLVLQLENCPAIGMNKVILNLLEPVIFKLKTGDKLKLVFTGLTKKKGKRSPARLFDVFVNGKQMENKFSGKQVDKATIQSFLDK